MENKKIMLFMLFVIIGSLLVGCGNDVEVKHVSKDVIEENIQEETNSQQEENTNVIQEEKSVEEADEVEEVGSVVNETELEEWNNITYYYNGEIIVPNIPDLQVVELRNLELRERSVENDRENHIAIVKGTILNKGSDDDSVIVVVKLYGKKFEDGEMYHTVEVEGRKQVDVPGNSEISFEFSIDYDDRVWYGYSFEFE